MIAADLADRFKEAMFTLRRMPTDRPREYKVAWPDVVQDVHDAYGYTPTTTRQAAPSPAAITRMDEALGWIMLIQDGPKKPLRKIVTGRAMGVHWTKLGRMAGKDRSTVKRWWMEEIWRLSRRV